MKILDIYTDASFGKDFKVVGIGTFLIDNEKEYSYQYKTNLKYLNIEFSTNSELITTSHGEAYGLLKALSFCNEKYEKINIYTDSFHIFSLMNNLSKVSKKDKLLIKIINKCKEKFSKLNVDIDIRHIKSHVGVYGNEVADNLATYSRYHETVICNKNNDINWLINFQILNIFNSINLENNISHKVKGINKYKCII